MSEQLSTAEKANQLGFLYKRILTQRNNLEYWMGIPEFVDEVYALYEKGAIIDNAMILSLMTEVYQNQKIKKKRSADFYYSLARNSIKQIKKKSSECDPKLAFMFRKISIYAGNLSYWMSVPGFKEEMLSKVKKGETVDNQVVYDTMSRIYSDMKVLSQNSPEDIDFNFELARKGMKQVRNGLNKQAKKQDCTE